MLMRMNARRMSLVVAVLLAVLTASAADVLANGLIISPVKVDRVERMPRIRRPIHSWMPFRVKSQRLDIEINDGVAETMIEQVFINESRGPSEGTYMFPIAENAGVHAFTMWMNGKEVTGELLDADRARRIYESVVSKMRDPGLLQFAGRGLIQAKVFPIPPGGECRIKLRYSEPRVVDAGLTGYRFPLRSGACRFQPIEQFSLKAVIRSQRPIASVFCPSHDCSIDRRSDREVVVGLEKARLQPENDFQLFTNFGDGAFGLSLLPFRVGGADGFFMARITPRIGGADEAVLPKNICFVLDTSGSMAESDKISQAKKALTFCITNLGPEDRFSVMAFSTEVRPFREGWSVADKPTITAARAFVDELRAIGGTDIDSALRQALALNPRAARSASGGESESWRKNPYFVVFITDGEPTVGVTAPAEILQNVARTNADKEARVFSLGVGFQVNTKLLDRLSGDNGGARDYVTPTENLELKISAFYTKLANPVLANLKLTFKGVTVHDVFPRRLPDLFKGSELVVVGRYSGAATESAKIELTGACRGEARGYTFAGAFPSDDRRHSFLPRVWAMRKIGFLLDELRLRGENTELKNEVIRLSKRYGILTPYTSFLVQEDERLALRERRRVIGPRPMARSITANWAHKDEDLDDAEAEQTASKGRASVMGSKSNSAFKKAKPEAAFGLQTSIGLFNSEAGGRQLINAIGPRTFYNEDGKWVDAAYDGKAETIKLVAFSRAYYEFLAGHAQTGPYLAQGERVVLKWDDRVYETVPPKSD
jgi:Ca-activated chloride channel family protein